MDGNTKMPLVLAEQRVARRVGQVYSRRPTSPRNEWAMSRAVGLREYT